VKVQRYDHKVIIKIKNYSGRYKKMKMSDMPNAAKIVFGMVPVAAGATVGAIVLDYLLSPENAMAAGTEEVVTCDMPSGADATIRNRVLESKKYSFLLVVKKGESIDEAIHAYATTYKKPGQQGIFITEATQFSDGMRYNRRSKFDEECAIPMCVSIEGCKPDELMALAAAGPIPAEAGAGPTETSETGAATAEAPIPPARVSAPVNHLPTVSAGKDLEGMVGQSIRITAAGKDEDNDALKYEWSLVSQPSEAGTKLDGVSTGTLSFTPNIPGQYKFSVKVNDGRGGIATDDVIINVKPRPFDYLREGMNPAAIFNIGLGNYVAAKNKKFGFEIEAGPLFGVATRTDNDTLTITDPVTGAVLDTVSINKVLKSDVSGFYANAFARIGDMTLISLNFSNMTENGNFKVDGEDVSSYKKKDTFVEMGLRRGIYHVPGKFMFAGDLFFGYMGSDDTAEDEYGTYNSKRDMFGGGAGARLAFRLEKKEFQAIPGLGMAYHYFSGGDKDMHSLLVTNGGVYDIKWSEFFSMGIDYRLRMIGDETSDKDPSKADDGFKTELTLHQIGLQMMFGKRRVVGFDGSYIISGDYSESGVGNLRDLEGSVTGFDLGLMGRVPTRWGGLGVRAGYGQRNTSFNNSQGKKEESFGSAGVFVQF